MLFAESKLFNFLLAVLLTLYNLSLELIVN